ncbi:MAG: neuromedin U [Gemmatimonadales bacterium]|nr:neuromedin U [Gemmatimonadales bacterium]
MATTFIGAGPVLGQESDADLAKVSQNPVGNIYNLPLQNNTDFKVGPNETTNNTLNIQPVIPVTVGKFNIINRGIIPVKWQGEVVEGSGSKSGLGDITYEGFLSPAAPGKVIWGLGVALIFPTATDDRLGTGKWQAGPGAILLTAPGKWVIGALAQNTWSFAGASDRSDVNFFFSQVFLNYNIKNGWYLTTSPIITANWEAESGEQWTVPLGGGAGKVARVGKIPVDFQIQLFYIAVKPEFGADWQLRLQAKGLFPK